MLKYEHKEGMSLCMFLDPDMVYCDDCDMRKRGICNEQFYKKYGRFKHELEEVQNEY